VSRVALSDGTVAANSPPSQSRSHTTCRINGKNIPYFFAFKIYSNLRCTPTFEKRSSGENGDECYKGVYVSNEVVKETKYF
jgi:hypothetical protein